MISEQKALEKNWLIYREKSQPVRRQRKPASATKTVNGVSVLVQKVAVDSPAALRNLPIN